MKKNNYMNTKEINKIVKSIITLVIAFVVLLMLPFLSGIIALPFLFINQPIAYWISRFIQNLYGPVIVIILLNLFPFVYPIIIIFKKKI